LDLLALFALLGILAILVEIASFYSDSWWQSSADFSGNFNTGLGNGVGHHKFVLAKKKMDKIKNIFKKYLRTKNCFVFVLFYW